MKDDRENCENDSDGEYWRITGRYVLFLCGDEMLWIEESLVFSGDMYVGYVRWNIL